ncbi:MAG: DUF1959 domain-containing protein [Methanomicrobiales archaeon]|nr:DUF1959 domain-containing protein [Methanomicrobiales archaeon]
MDLLYEKNLRTMQYNILTSTRHDAVVVAIAERYGLKKQEVRRIMMERMDMILLENMPARYDAWRDAGDEGDRIAKGLGCDLVTRFLPLMGRSAADRICSEAREEIARGTPEEDALKSGRARMGEEIRAWE